MRHLRSLSELSVGEFRRIVERGAAFARGVKPFEALRGGSVGLYFRHTSTRTRTAFGVAAARLGASVVAYGPHDLQVNTGESLIDTGRVLAHYLDALVVRSADDEEHLSALAQQDRMSVVNAMSRREHPTQALADFTTIRERLGRLEDVHILYVGEGNNTASALALALARAPGMRLTLLTPEGYGLPADVLREAAKGAEACGASIEELHDADRAPRGVDVVYTTRWQTTGTTKPDPNWRGRFAPFRVSVGFFERVARARGTLFMHDLPAQRGEEVDVAVLEGAASIVFEQARNKLFGAMAVLEWCHLA